MDSTELSALLVKLKLPKLHVEFFLNSFNQRGVSLLYSADAADSDRLNADRKELANFLLETFPFVLQRQLKAMHRGGVFLARDKRSNSDVALYLTCDVSKDPTRFRADEFRRELQKQLDVHPVDSNVVRARELVVHKSARLGHCIWLASEPMSCSLADVLRLYDLAAGDRERSPIRPCDAAVKPRVPFVGHEIVAFVARQLTEAVHAYACAGLPFDCVRPSKVLLASNEWTRRVLDNAQSEPECGDKGSGDAKTDEPVEFSASDARRAIGASDEAAREDIHGRKHSPLDLAERHAQRQKRAVQLLGELRLEHFVGLKLGGFFNLHQRIIQHETRITTEDHFKCRACRSTTAPHCQCCAVLCTI